MLERATHTAHALLSLDAYVMLETRDLTEGLGLLLQKLKASIGRSELMMPDYFRI